jgi:hypothetical protein
MTRAVRAVALRRIDGFEQGVEVVILVKSVATFESLTQDTQVSLSQQSHGHDVILVRHSSDNLRWECRTCAIVLGANGCAAVEIGSLAGKIVALTAA